SLTNEFLKPINDLVNFGSTLQDLESDLMRLDDVLENPIDPIAKSAQSEDAAASVTVNRISFRLSGKLELQNLTFGYSRFDPPLIENLSITLQPGQRIALVGGSGSGKSTVAKLITGLYPIWSGEILLDGIER
ncbi:MAG: ATP-binding cassette domain-containing protein, partial [Microcystis panniformis]